MSKPQDETYFVLAKLPENGGCIELAKPGSPDALPYVARQQRALSLARLRIWPWQLLELRQIPAHGTSWCVVLLDDDGQREVAVEPLAAPQSEAVQTSIDAQDRWSGPISPKELLPHAWEGRLRLRNGKPVFTKV